MVQSESCVHCRATAAKPSPASSLHATPTPPVPPPVPVAPPVPMAASPSEPPAPAKEPSARFPAPCDVLPQAPAHPTNRKAAHRAKPHAPHGRRMLASSRDICRRYNSNMRATRCKGSFRSPNPRRQRQDSRTRTPSSRQRRPHPLRILMDPGLGLGNLLRKPAANLLPAGQSITRATAQVLRLVPRSAEVFQHLVHVFAGLFSRRAFGQVGFAF